MTKVTTTPATRAAAYWAVAVRRSVAAEAQASAAWDAAEATEQAALAAPDWDADNAEDEAARAWDSAEVTAQAATDARAAVRYAKDAAHAV